MVPWGDVIAITFEKKISLFASDSRLVLVDVNTKVNFCIVIQIRIFIPRKSLRILYVHLHLYRRIYDDWTLIYEKSEMLYTTYVDALNLNSLKSVRKSKFYMFMDDIVVDFF